MRKVNILIKSSGLALFWYTIVIMGYSLEIDVYSCKEMHAKTCDARYIMPW